MAECAFASEEEEPRKNVRLSEVLTKLKLLGNSYELLQTPSPLRPDVKQPIVFDAWLWPGFNTPVN